MEYTPYSHKGLDRVFLVVFHFLARQVTILKGPKKNFYQTFIEPMKNRSTVVSLISTVVNLVKNWKILTKHSFDTHNNW